MAFFDRFLKRWASNGAIAEPSMTQADTGFAFLGSDPPTVEQFNALLQWLDDKDNWLFGQLDQVLRAGGVTPGPTPNTQLLSALRTLYGGGGALGPNGWQKLPGGLIVQWGAGATTSAQYDLITFPIAFPTAARVVVANEANAIGWDTAGVSVFGRSNVTQANFRLYVRTWNGSRFLAAAGIAHNWIALGH